MEKKEVNELNAKTWTLRAIKESIDPEKENITIEGEYVVVTSNEEPFKLKAIFKKAGYRYAQFDLQEAVKMIVSKLAPQVDVKKFLEELILLHSSVEEIIDLRERLEKGYVKVKEAERCYSLMVGGKRGRPYEFNLVG